MNNQFVTEEELTDMLDDKKGYLHDQVNEMNDAIKATPEYKLGKKLLNGEISNLTTENIVDVKDSEIRMNLLLSTFSEEISISEKMELIQNMITELKHVRRLLQDLKKEGTHVE